MKQKTRTPKTTKQNKKNKNRQNKAKRNTWKKVTADIQTKQNWRNVKV